MAVEACGLAHRAEPGPSEDSNLIDTFTLSQAPTCVHTGLSALIAIILSVSRDFCIFMERSE